MSRELRDITNRPSFEQIYMDLAESMSQRSTCYRLAVGAVITTTEFRKVLAVGYNGGASGAQNGCDDPYTPGNCGCLHAEENCIINCSAERYVEKVFFVTHLPCIMCAKRIINLGGVKKVIFKNEYRQNDSVSLLWSAGIPIYQMDDSGVIKEYQV